MAAVADNPVFAARLGRIGLGCATFGREIDASTAFSVMDHAVALGLTHFDTAASYSAGGSERVVGAWLAARRLAKPPLVATKLKPPYTPAAMRQAVDDSRRRLGLPVIDLLYLHQWSDEWLNPPTLAALQDFVARGEVLALGASNLMESQLTAVLDLQRSLGLPRLNALQNNHNFAVREVSAAVRLATAREGLAVVTYSPLGAGFLTGKHKAGVAAGSRFEVLPGHQKIYFTEPAWRRLAKLEAVSRATGVSLPMLALSWAFNQPGPPTVLVGGRSTAHLDQAAQALALGRPDWLSQLEGD